MLMTKILLKKKEQSENEEVVIWVRAKGDIFCIEVELDMKMFHTKLTDLQIRVGSQAFMCPNSLI